VSSRLNILRCLVFLALSALHGFALTLEELEKSYEQKLSDVRLEKEKSLADLNEGYLAALARIEAKYQKAGRLDELMLTRQEIKDLTDKKWPLNALPEKISLEVAAPRKIYLQKRIEIERQAARKSTDTADKMLALLDKQAVDLTKEGNLQQALLARQIKAEIEANKELGTARELLSNVMSDGTTRNVLRLRRYGDNVEVLVKHDTRGQISFLSPIQNAEESDKTIGDTTAKNLGEFVGAKGYDPDPLTIYRQGDKENQIGKIQLIGIEGSEEIQDKQTALRLSFDLKHDNPRGSFDPSGPRASAPGAVRVRGRFQIPKSNKVLSGVIITQGGAPIVLADASKPDVWNEMDGTGESRAEHEAGTILFYLKGHPNSNIANAAQDYLLLKDLDIEIVRFSAFLVQRFDKNGTELEHHDTPDKQPLFITNGDFVTAPSP
jgi:hypothetical protein